jgi:two-component system, NtrC family, sensor histidine kinase PilS
LVGIAKTELRRRIGYLMVYRVALITLVLGLTVALNLASPEELAGPSARALFAIIIATYVLSLGYAVVLPRVEPTAFATAQIAGDLLITTILVHVTGGAQSGYSFFYPLSIVGAATVRHRRGAIAVAALSVVCFAGVALAGWLRLVPVPAGQHLLPWELSFYALLRHLLLNVGAFVAIAFLAANLGEQLAHAGERLAHQRERALDMAALKDDIVHCLSSGLMTVDLDGRVLTANAAAEEILGRPREGLLDRPLGDILPGLPPLLAGLPRRADLRGIELPVRRDGVELMLGITVTPLTDHRDQVIGRVANFQDLTELRRMETEVKEAERLAAVGRLAAGIAHEIRNPLASISGSIELLRGGLTLGAEDAHLMDIVLREVDRLNVLITDLLDYARPRERVPIAFDLGDLLEETVRVFAQERSGGRVQVSYRPVEGARVVADPDQIRQVVWNLLRNASEAIPERGGAIEVTLEQVREGGRTYAAFAVSDEGTGIASEDLPRVFDPLFTTKAHGSGLGLATVQRIISAHGGHIGVSSKVGEGTRFTVRLPMPSGPAQP